MGEELRVPTRALTDIRGELGKGREALERTARTAPSSIDAGDLTAMLTGMVSRVAERSAALSEGLAGVRAQVAEAGTHFWALDDDVAATYGAPGGRPVPQ